MPADNHSDNPTGSAFTVRVDPAEIEAADLAAKVDVPPAELPVAGPPLPADDAAPAAARPPAPRHGPQPPSGARAGVGRGRGAAPSRRYAFRRS